MSWGDDPRDDPPPPRGGRTDGGRIRQLRVGRLLRAVPDFDRCSVCPHKPHRSRIYRGGLSKFQRAQKDLALWMKEDQNADAWFSTMFDVYRLPPDFPEYEDARRKA